MIDEAEIRNYRNKEYLGLWIVDDGSGCRKSSLKFSPDNLEKLKSLDDAVNLTIGVEFISVREFKEKHLSHLPIVTDPNDTEPTTWSVLRRYQD